MAKYKIGDVIFIKRNLDSEICVPEMYQYAGMRSTISYVDNIDGTYKLDIDNRRWWWDNECFEDAESTEDEFEFDISESDFMEVIFGGKV